MGNTKTKQDRNLSEREQKRLEAYCRQKCIEKVSEQHIDWVGLK